MKVIIAAAGTAGHINPGLSIANTIKKNDILKNIQDIISNENYKEDESSSEQIDELISCIQSNLQSN